jgi:hypothetical protein
VDSCQRIPSLAAGADVIDAVNRGDVLLFSSCATVETDGCVLSEDGGLDPLMHVKPHPCHGASGAAQCLLDPPARTSATKPRHSSLLHRPSSLSAHDHDDNDNDNDAPEESVAVTRTARDTSSRASLFVAVLRRPCDLSSPYARASLRGLDAAYPPTTTRPCPARATSFYPRRLCSAIARPRTITITAHRRASPRVNVHCSPEAAP